jgi:hypothetical protein
VRRKLGILLIATVLLIGCRGWLYRLLIRYQPVAERELVPLRVAGLQQEIASLSPAPPLTLEDIRDIAFALTTRQLSFSRRAASADPNTAWTTGRAHCVGYAALFHAIAHELIRQYGLEDQLEARHLVGKLELLGLDLHRFFDSPFFADHDYNLLRDRHTGETIRVDPSVGDYLWIKSVRSK